MLGIETLEDVDVFHDASPVTGKIHRNDQRKLEEVAEARLRPSGYAAAAFATIGLAEPKLAKHLPVRLRPAGFGATAFADFATRGYRACRAVAGEASEGWWSQAGSNRRPRHCERRALPAELWPRRDRPGRRPTIVAIYLPGTAQVKNGKSAVFRIILAGTSLVCRGMNRYLAVHPTSRALPPCAPFSTSS